MPLLRRGKRPLLKTSPAFSYVRHTAPSFSRTAINSRPSGRRATFLGGDDGGKTRGALIKDLDAAAEASYQGLATSMRSVAAALKLVTKSI